MENNKISLPERMAEGAREVGRLVERQRLLEQRADDGSATRLELLELRGLLAKKLLITADVRRADTPSNDPE